MAKKIGNVHQAAAVADEKADLANELEVLHPERVVKLSDGKRKLMVREYGHVEWMLMLAEWEPLIAAIAEQLRAGAQVSYEQALGVIAQHIEPMLPLIGQAADLTPDEIRALAPDDGERLFLAWWSANGRFFVVRAANRVRMQGHEAAARRQVLAELEAKASDTAASTPGSSPTATPPKRSRGTQSAS